jgi:hypothetical protein
MTYCFAECFDALEAKGFQHEILTSMNAAVEISNVFNHFTWFMKLVLCVPERISIMLNPHTKGLITIKKASPFREGAYEGLSLMHLQV